MLTVATGLGALAVGVTLALVIARSITGPIVRITRQITDLGGSCNFRERIDLEGRNEITVMASSLNALLADLSEVLADVNAVMDGVAEGDLTRRVTAEAKGDFAHLRENINRSVQALSGAFGSVMDDVLQVTAAATQAVGQISIGVQSQMIALRQISGNMAQAAQSVQEVSASAEQTSRHTEATGGMMERGRQSVDGMIETVRAIASINEKVSQITGVMLIAVRSPKPPRVWKPPGGWAPTWSRSPRGPAKPGG